MTGETTNDPQTTDNPPATPPADPPPSTPPVDAAPLADPPATPDPWGDIEDDLKTFIGDKTPADVAKELQNAQGLIGKKQVGIPTAESTPEEWQAFHTARGVPEKAEGYDFSAVRDELLKDVPEDQREGMWDAAEESRFRELAKAANLSSREASELLQRELAHRMETSAAAQAAAAKVSKEASDMITEKWGAKKDEFTQDANIFARAMGLDGDMLEAIQELSAASAETRFKLVDFMRKQGELMREGGQPGDLPGAMTPAGMTPDQARAAKQQYLAQGDNAAAYNDSNHPSHKTVTAKVTEFLKVERGIKA